MSELYKIWSKMFLSRQCLAPVCSVPAEPKFVQELFQSVMTQTGNKIGAAGATLGWVIFGTPSVFNYFWRHPV